MNKLESIKEAFKERGHVNFGYDFENEDVEKLLQRLERYEKALKGVIEQSDSNNCNWCGDTIKVIAEEVLNHEIT